MYVLAEQHATMFSIEINQLREHTKLFACPVLGLLTRKHHIGSGRPYKVMIVFNDAEVCIVPIQRYYLLQYSTFFRLIKPQIPDLLSSKSGFYRMRNFLNNLKRNKKFNPLHCSATRQFQAHHFSIPNLRFFRLIVDDQDLKLSQYILSPRIHGHGKGFNQRKLMMHLQMKK